MLKATGVGLLGLAGLSATDVSMGHGTRYEASAEDLLGTTLVPADSEAGFNFPYYLSVPKTNQEGPLPILVEPNNTGSTTDDFQEHRNNAEGMSDGTLGFSRTLSEALEVPLLVPAFPRPQTEPVDGNHYVHALDETTMNLDSGALERVDLQLLSMVDHARELLAGLSHPVGDEIIMNGFSASGNFVNRFPALHPERVRSVTAGAINGTAILPLTEAAGHTLNYHIGVADFESLVGEEFDRERWRDVAQFIYMGSEDTNDTIPYDDAWSDRQRQIALDVYGDDMQEDRMPYCESVYEDAGATATFEIYDGVEHNTNADIQEDIVDFHRRHIGFTDVSFARPPIAGETAVSIEATAPADGNQSFDVRAFSESTGDVTESVATIESGESIETTVSLTTALDVDDTVTVVLVESGVSDRDRAIAEAEATVIETASVRVVAPPTVDRPRITVEYAVDGGYVTDAPIHVHLSAGSRDQQLLDTFSPGTSTTDTYLIETDGFETTFEAGTELTVTLTDVDGGGELIAANTAVEATERTGERASIEFAVQPTYGADEFRAEYSLDEEYDVDEFVAVRFRIEDTVAALVDVIEPGDSGTETISVDGLPVEPGDAVELSVEDGALLDDDRTVTVADEADEVQVEFVDQPTAEDPQATVEYSIAAEYQVDDVVTLRSYSDQLPGKTPGRPLALLSPGQEATETFTVREDADLSSTGTGVTVAVMDREPLAVAESQPFAGGDGSSGSADEDGTTEQTETTSTPTATPEATATDTHRETATDTPTDTVTNTPTDAPTTNGVADREDATGTTSEDGPGFGLASALSGIGGAGYLLKRRLRRDDE